MATRITKEQAQQLAQQAFAAQSSPENWGVPTSPVALVAPDEDSDAPETAADRVAIALDQVAGDERAYVRLWRVSDGSERTFCEDFTPQQFEEGGLTLIRERWGPGRYFIALYGTVPGTKRFTIRTKGEVTIAEMRGQSTPQNLGVAPANNEMSVALRGIMETQKAMLEAITQRPAVDPMANMRDMLQMAALMRDAFGQPQSHSKSSIAEIVEAIKELQGVSKLVNPPVEEKEPDLLSLGAKVLDLVKSAQVQETPQVIAPIAVPPAVAIASPSPVETIAQTESEEQMLINALRALLAEMLEKAKTKADAKEAAETLYENLPEDFDELIKSEQWFAVLTNFAPELREHEEWVRSVHANLLTIYAEEAAGSDELPQPQ